MTRDRFLARSMVVVEAFLTTFGRSKIFLADGQRRRKSFPAFTLDDRSGAE
jgi:hypothetical protein